jgi:hypothetical protein
MSSVPTGDRTPTWATSARVYKALIVRIDKWLASGWATDSQRQELADRISNDNTETEAQES